MPLMKSVLAVLAPVPIPPLLWVLVLQALAWLVRALTNPGSTRAAPRPPLSPS